MKNHIRSFSGCAINNMKSQEDVLSLLEKIQRAATDDSLAAVCFQLRALLPDCSGNESLVELSSLLMQSDEFYSIAVPLIRFILQDECNKDESDALLQKYVNSKQKYETNIHLPSLQLRVLLAKIAVCVDSNDVETFMNHFARHTLEMNPDRFKASSNYCSMLKLFEKLIVNGKFGPDGSDLSELCRLLLVGGRNDLIHLLEDFSTLREYVLAVMDVNSESNLRSCLQNNYRCRFL